MFPLVEAGAALDAERLARYSRQIALPGFGEIAQRRLRAARVLVIGAGGLGSATVPALAGAGVGTIGVIDDDRVELSNLHRQLSHGVADIDRPKVTSLAETVHAINPECEFVSHELRATAETLPGLLEHYDLLLDGSDNFPTRYLANDAGEIVGKPLVWGSILRFQGQVGVSWSGHGPTFRDLFPEPPTGEVLSCEAGGVLPSLCTAVGSFMATEALKLIAGIGEPLLGRVLFYDALTARTREIPYAADPARSPVTELIDYELFCGQAVPGADAITAVELMRRVRQGDPPRLIDVREANEVATRRIPGAEHLPVGRIEAGERPSPDGPDTRGASNWVVYCERDPRSRQAARALAAVAEESGIAVSYLVGGIRAFVSAGGEVEEDT